MVDEKPRLGPWLRHYGRNEEVDRRERSKELALGAAAALGFLGVLVVVLLVFVRYPLPTFATLVALWGVGFTALTVKRRRAERRERALRESAGRD